VAGDAVAADQFQPVALRHQLVERCLIVGGRQADDETLVGRLPGYFAVLSSFLLPKEQ
jgi:hypothetical protein